MPKELAVLFILCSTLATTFGLIWAIYAYYKRQALLTKHKFSDAAIFSLMTRANHFLTPEQLTAVAPLTLAEAKMRLTHLHAEGVLRQYGSTSGAKIVYQLREVLPTSNDLPINIDSLNNTEIMASIEQYSADYEVTAAELVIIFGIDIYEAKQLLKRLQKANLLTRLLSKKGFIYAVKNPILQGKPKVISTQLDTPILQQKVALNTLSKIKIPDATVIDLAIQYQGKLTPTLLCVKLKISLEEATQKLEELQEQGAFVLDINDKNSLIEYHLRNQDLLHQ